MQAPHILFITIGIALILTAGCTQQAPGVPASPAVTMTCPVAPVPVPSTEGVNIAYELELFGLDEAALVPETIDVIDPATGATLYTPDAATFTRAYQKAAHPPPTAEERMRGTLRLTIPRISLWFKVKPGAVPDRLVHRLTLNRSAAGLAPLVVTGGEVAVRKDIGPVVIGAPVKRPGWVVMETTSGTTHHFLMPVTVNNRTTVDQRYAQDWFAIDPVTGNAAGENATLAKNFYGYGRELLAVADGTVVETRDGVPDNEIIYHLPPFAFETGTGNNVIIDIGNKKYACYCHIIPGTIKVRKGETVKQGQVIGLLGNSGQSDIPHLHFEVVTDTPAIIGGEGYPFVFTQFDIIAEKFNLTELETKGSLPKYAGPKTWTYFGEFVTFRKEPVPQKGMLQENWAIVRFP